MRFLYLMCALCRRDRFTSKAPHRCSGGFRKRNIIWITVYEVD